MKVHVAIAAYPPSLGGAQLHTAELVRHLATAKVSPRVSCLWRATRTDWLAASTLRLPRTYRTTIRDEVRVDELTLQGGTRPFDWVVAPLYYPLRRFGSTYFARRLDFRYEGEDIIHVVRLGREHLALRAAAEARAAGIPMTLTPNHHPAWSLRRDPVWRRLYLSADHLFALTHTEAVELQRLGVPRNRITVTGVGPVLASDYPDRSSFLESHGLPDRRYVAFLGQQFPYKRIDLVVAAFELLSRGQKDVGLLIAGPTARRTLQLVNRSPLANRIHVLGEVSRADKTALLREIECLLFPSEQESFGGVLLEAAWMGTPYVASNLPQLLEVSNRVGGGTCVPPDARLIATAAEMYLKGRRSTTTRRLEEEFSWDALGSRYVRTYEALLRAA